MEWILWPWDQAFGRSADRPATDRRKETAGTSPKTGAESCDYLDIWAIVPMYQAIAAGSSCEVCGARLARRLGALAVPANARWPRRLLVVAQCRGWRHHVHAATVVINEGDDIRLPPLRATG